MRSRLGASWSRAVSVSVLLWSLAAGPAHAQEATPLSAATLPPGQVAIAARTGFPYLLSVDAMIGLGRRFDLSIQGRAAWQDVRRVGLEGRIRLTNPDSPRGFALKLGVDSWTDRPASHSDGSNPWLDITGLQDVTGWVDGVFSWTTPRGTVMSAMAGLALVGTRDPPVGPLAGTPAFLTFGPNLTVRIAAEIPFRAGFLFAFDLGVDIHLSGFDNAVAMPEASVGLGYRL